MATGNETRGPATGPSSGLAPQVRHPLDAVRGLIRRYVFSETAAIVLLALAAWFWIGLFVDYGLFLATAYDWVQELNFVDASGQASVWVRLAILVGVLGVVGYLIATRLLLRWGREFSDPAVALVLERRFPKELGDRLITAVEMADPKKAEAYGVSGELLRKTIEEAAERVSRAPASEVFDWARLRRGWRQAALVAFGTLFAVGAGTLGIQALRGKAAAPMAFVWDFRDVASIWFERNVLLRDSYWLRNNHVELVRFQDAPSHPGEMRVGRDEQRPDLIARTVEWVAPDRAAPSGWRALRVSEADRFVAADVLAAVKIPESWDGWAVDLDDLDGRVPAGAISEDLQGKSYGELRKAFLATPEAEAKLQAIGALDSTKALGAWKQWSVDKLLLQVGKTDVRRRLDAEFPGAGTAIEAFEQKLTEAASRAGMARSLRKLLAPVDLSATFRGDTTYTTTQGDTLADRKFAFKLADLKESSNFFVRGGDFFTRPLRIALVPPPSLREILRDTEEPAYLYQRIVGDQVGLKGKKQKFVGRPASVTGESTSIDVPYGTNLTLRAKADRPLKAGVRIRPASQVREVGIVVPDVPVTRDADGLGFQARFDQVTKTLEFQFEFEDEDHVKGRRKVRIRPIDDQPPEILNADLAVVLRKPRMKEGLQKALAGAASEGFLVTPAAILPFAGTVRDDVSLTQLRWAYETRTIHVEKGAEKDTLVLQGNPAIRRTGLVVSALQFGTPSPTSALAAVGYQNFVGRFLSVDLARKEEAAEKFAVLAAFQESLARLEETPLGSLDAKLVQPPAARLPHQRDHSLKDAEFFSIKAELPDLKLRDPSGQSQLFHLVKLSLTATDNNVETGPSTSRTRTPLLLLVVPETELLAQIGLEEEVLRERLEKVLQKLKAAQTTMAAQLPALKTFADLDYNLVALRADEVRKSLLDSASTTREVYADYARILRELEVNQCKKDKISDVRGKIVDPLELTVRGNLGGFSIADDLLSSLYSDLDGDIQAKRIAAGLPKRFETATQANDQILGLIDQIQAVLSSIDQGLDFNAVIERVVELERSQRQVGEPLRRYHDEEVEKILRSLIEGK